MTKKSAAEQPASWRAFTKPPSRRALRSGTEVLDFEARESSTVARKICALPIPWIALSLREPGTSLLEGVRNG